MSSDEEEMSDHFELEEDNERPFSHLGSMNVNSPNKSEKPLLEQYEEKRKVEEAQHAGRRQAAIVRIRACLSQNPKLEIGKSSVLQEKLNEMTDDQLESTAESFEDQLGMSSTLTIPKGLVRGADEVLQRAFGLQINPKAYDDVQLLSIIGKKLPALSYHFSDWIQLAMKLAEYISPAPAENIPFVVPVSSADPMSTPD